MAWDIDIKCKIYQRLANEIFFRIYNGTYPLGSKLITYPVLAKEAGSSPETVRKAVLLLQKHGIIEKNRYGYFVTSNYEKVLEFRDSYLAAIEREYVAAKQKVEGTNNGNHIDLKNSGLVL